MSADPVNSSESCTCGGRPDEIGGAAHRPGCGEVPVNSSDEREVARSKSALRRLPVGSVVLSNTYPYEGWAWQKTAHQEWWAQDSNRMPTDRMVAFLGPLTVIYRPGVRRG